MAFALYLGVFLCGVASVFSLQKYGRAVKSFNEIWIYAFITGIIASVNFIILSGFTLDFNLNILIYSLVIALLAILSYFMSLTVYKYMEISAVSVIQNGGRLILAIILGMLIFSEIPGFVSVVRIACTLAALLSIYFIGKRRQGEKSKNTPKGLLLCIFGATTSAISTVNSKFIAIDPAVKNSNHVFFFTNVFIVGAALIAILLSAIKNKKLDISYAKGISAKKLLLIFLSTMASNISSLLGVLILKSGNIELYAPLSGALNIIAAEAVAVFMAKEKPQIVPIAFSVLATLLGFFG